MAVDVASHRSKAFDPRCLPHSRFLRGIQLDLLCRNVASYDQKCPSDMITPSHIFSD